MNGVIDRDGVYDQMDAIALPTLIAVGDQHIATVPAKSERMHARTKNSQMVTIPGAGHTSSLEEPDAANAALHEFLSWLETIA